ncbi:MAG: acyltransferase [Bacteroides sp.]|nr:acyltransferase [Bacteroides sp.]MCM1548419.1 acyltransferase [Clostridium sp.]
MKARIRNCEIDKKVLTKEDSTSLRGLAALFVMFSHYILFIENKFAIHVGPAKILEWFGGLGVCLFFFLSGYGCYLSLDKKEVRLSFLWKRFMGILPTYLILRIIFGLLLKEYDGGIISSLLYILGLRAPFWFVSEIIIIYILLYIAAKLNKRHVIGIMTILLCIMSFIFWLLHFEARWYNANLVFCLGMLFAKKRDIVLDFLQKSYWLKCVGIICLFGLFSGGFVVFKTNTFSVGLKLIAGGLFCFIFVLFLMKIKIASPVIMYIGKKSLHFYMIHLYVQNMYDKMIYIENAAVWIILCILTSLTITVIYGLLEDGIRKRIGSKSSEKIPEETVQNLK